MEPYVIGLWIGRLPWILLGCFIVYQIVKHYRRKNNA